MRDTITRWTPYQAQRAQLAYDRAVQAGDPDPLGFVAQLYAESRFQPSARSNKNAQGEAQFIPSTAKRFGVDVNDPDSSQLGALKYRNYIRNFNAKRGLVGEDYVLSGYNAGEGVAAKALTGYKETREYVRRIKAYAPQLAALMGLKPGQAASTSAPSTPNVPPQSTQYLPYIETQQPSYARGRTMNFDSLFNTEPRRGLSDGYDETDIMGSMYRALNESLKRTLLGG